MRAHRRIAATAALLLALAATSRAEEAAAPVDLSQSVDALKQRNRDLERRLADLESKMGEGADAQRLRREEVRMIVEQMIGEAKSGMVPGWLSDLKFAGDLRLRYEYRDRSGAPQRDDRGRFRLRFGFTKAWPKDDLEIGFRLATGADNDPTSTNQSFGNMFQEYTVGIDRAYARWAPKQLKGFSLTAGKMAIPWESTNLTWDTDVNPDGVWAEWKVPDLGALEPFVGAGVFELFSSPAQPEANLAVYQAGLRYAFTKDVKLSSAVVYYDYSNIDSAFANVAFFNANPRGNTVRGGRLAAGEFGSVNLVNKLDWVAYNLPMSAFVDFVHNTQDQDRLTDADNGLAIGFKVGQNKKKGDWSARYIWKHLEADATLAFFADSDFGFGSSTNRRGSELGFEYNFTDYLTAGVSFFVTEPDSGRNSEHRFTFQGDLVWKF